MSTHVDYAIRAAELDDAAEIARLSGELGYPVDAASVARHLALLLPRAAHHVLVAATESGLRGWISAERRVLVEAGERVELVTLVVDARARRSGIGQALVQTVEQWTLAQGLDTLVVRSNVQRVESHPFYQRLGFKQTKTQHSYAKTLSGKLAG
jgi:GNAT superfamily N-acetyltransferase